MYSYFPGAKTLYFYRNKIKNNKKYTHRAYNNINWIYVMLGYTYNSIYEFSSVSPQWIWVWESGKNGNTGDEIIVWGWEWERVVV